jgi:peptidoglycan/xylan/chitin deacetylase (PgdA/CDA1 family)
MTFYAPRNIGPADQVLFDADGNAVGIQPAASSSPPVLGFNPTKHAAIDSLVSKAGNDPAPAVRPGRGYVVAADLRAANVAATVGSPVITDVERIAPDGTKLRGIRIASTGSGTNCSFDINIRSSTFATGRLSMLIYSDHTATGFDPNVALYVGDNSSLTNHFVGNSWLANSRGWQTIAPGITGGAAHNKWIASGTAAWGTTAFTRVRVRLDYTTTNTPWIEVYELNYNEDATSWLSITVDDGWDTAYTLGAPALERYGMRGSFAIIADLIGTAGYMTLANLQDLRDRGHECVVHGPIGGTGSLVNYIASGSRLAAVTADVKFHRDYLVNNGLNVRGSANCYVFPQGYDRFAAGNEDIRDALESQGFIGGRRSAFSRQQKRSLRGGNPWTWHTIGHEWTTDPAEAANITTIVSRINGAATEKQDAVLMLHKFVTGAAAAATEINMTNLETLLQAIADNRAAGTQDVVLFSRLAYAMAGLERPVV